MAAKLPVLHGETQAPARAWRGASTPSSAEQSPVRTVRTWPWWRALRSWRPRALTPSKRVPDVPGVFRAPGRGPQARWGQPHGQRCWARWTRRWTWAWRPSAGRTRCPARSRTSTCRRRWSASRWPRATRDEVLSGPSSSCAGSRSGAGCARSPEADGVRPKAQSLKAGAAHGGDAHGAERQGAGGVHAGLRRHCRGAVQDGPGQPAGLQARRRP